MLISKKMNAAINHQIGNEFGASLQYVAIASRFAGEGLTALAAHFYKQAEEERGHAMRFVHYLDDAGGKVEIPTIPAPNCFAILVPLFLFLDMVRTRRVRSEPPTPTGAGARRERRGARQEMKQRFLLDRVNVKSARVAISERV